MASCCWKRGADDEGETVQRPNEKNAKVSFPVSPRGPPTEPPRSTGVGVPDEVTSDQEQKASPSKEDGQNASAESQPVAPYARLVVTVDRGEDLIGMDPSLNLAKMALEKTLDAYVCVGINDAEPFGETDVQWKSQGDPKWTENNIFSVDITHPKSYLCVFVFDDDPVFRHQFGPLSHRRNCGFIEIPLWKLPRNKAVNGWFALTHPDLAGQDGSIADRRQDIKDNAAEGKGNAHDNKMKAGHLKLTLMLETTLQKEFYGYMQPPPVFAQSLPDLDVPGFMGDVFEVKRLALKRLIGAAIGAVLFAISWKNVALSSTVLCWHWFVWYYPQYIWASIWILVLLCFWHDIPQIPEKQKEDTSEDSEEPANESEEDKSYLGMASSGLSKSVATVGRAVGTVGGAIGDGIETITDNIPIGAPGMQEFQQILQLKPSLRDMVRGFQPSAESAQKGLKSVDDFFYWANFQTTRVAVVVVLAAFLVSVLFRNYMKVMSAYGHLLVGSLVLTMKAPFFKGFISGVSAAIAVASAPKTPFPKCSWFKAAA